MRLFSKTGKNPQVTAGRQPIEWLAGIQKTLSQPGLWRRPSQMRILTLFLHLRYGAQELDWLPCPVNNFQIPINLSLKYLPMSICIRCLDV